MFTVKEPKLYESRTKFNGTPKSLTHLYNAFRVINMFLAECYFRRSGQRVRLEILSTSICPSQGTGSTIGLLKKAYVCHPVESTSGIVCFHIRRLPKSTNRRTPPN